MNDTVDPRYKDIDLAVDAGKKISFYWKFFKHSLFAPGFAVAHSIGAPVEYNSYKRYSQDPTTWKGIHKKLKNRITTMRDKLN